MIKFSIVMSVYNVKDYLREALDSIKRQTIGFKNIQIIFVDDGSTDGSAEICNHFARKNSANCMVIHKNNGGQASARNEGLKYVKGKYVSFFDPDDILDKSAFEKVFDFLESHNEVDMACIPIIFFGDIEGQHPLNDKFESGSRVINLEDEPNRVLLSCASSFYRAEVVSKMHFDEKLITAEDAKENIKLLIDSPLLGVVSNTAYYYRKRGDSTVGSAPNNKRWYIDYLDRYTYWAIDYSLKKCGEVPKFVQYYVMQDLQWKYLAREVPKGILDLEEIRLYQDRLFGVVKYIDDEVIQEQKSIHIEHKLFLLSLKNECTPNFVLKTNGCVNDGCMDAAYSVDDISLTHLWFIKVNDSCICVEGDVICFDSDCPPELFLWIEKHNLFIKTVNYNCNTEIYSAGIKIATYYGFRGIIDTCDFEKEEMLQVAIARKLENKIIIHKRIIYGQFMPISNDFPNSYYYKNSILILPKEDGFTIFVVDSSMYMHIYEKNYKKALIKENNKYARHALVARIVFGCLKSVVPKNIWIIMDKAGMADDNGEAFFTYLVENKKEDVLPIFVIAKNSCDYERVKKLGHVVPYMSYKHKLLYLFSEYVISAYSHIEVSTPFLVHNKYYSNLINDKKIVFLQHGIIKDDLSDELRRPNKNYSLFVTSVEREWESVVHGNYGYLNSQVILTGLPRYDYLYDDKKKKVTVMPTWRRKLVGRYNSHTSQWTLKSGFEQSAFFQFYQNLLTNRELLSKADKFGYTIQFMMHPVLQPYVSLFNFDERVRVLNTSSRYRDIFAESALILTDYSSVAFDFGYLNKPVIYAHFDGNHYKEGYFDYEKDGFGEVNYTLEETINCLVDYMENDCKLKPMYKKRIDSFFKYHDTNNCERIYNQIINLRDKK